MRAWVGIRADASQFSSDVRSAAPGIESTIAGMANRFKGLASVVGVGFGLWEIVGAMKASQAAGEQSIDAQQRLMAAVVATGEAAGLSAGDLIKQATSLMKITNIEDEAIMGAMTRLLRFKNVTGDVFTSTIKLATDMAAGGFGSVESSAFMLGRAMEDPTHGMMMLRRQGIMLSEEQKDQIKNWVESGELLKAQTLILDVVKSKYGNVAKAMANTPTGRIKAMRVEIGELREEMGRRLMPAFEALTKVQLAWQQTLTNNAGAVNNVVMSVQGWNKATGGLLWDVGKIAASLTVLKVAWQAITLVWGYGPLSAIKALGTSFAWLGAHIVKTATWMNQTSFASLLTVWTWKINAMANIIKTRLITAFTWLVSPIGLATVAITAFVGFLAAVAVAYVNAELKGISYGDSILDLTHKMTGLNNKFVEWLELQEREKGLGQTFGRVEKAAKEGNREAFNAEIAGLQKQRATAQQEANALREKAASRLRGEGIAAITPMVIRQREAEDLLKEADTKQGEANAIERQVKTGQEMWTREEKRRKGLGGLGEGTSSKDLSGFVGLADLGKKVQEAITGKSVSSLLEAGNKLTEELIAIERNKTAGAMLT